MSFLWMTKWVLGGLEGFGQDLMAFRQANCCNWMKN